MEFRWARDWPRLSIDPHVPWNTHGIVMYEMIANKCYAHTRFSYGSLLRFSCKQPRSSTESRPILIGIFRNPMEFRIGRNLFKPNPIRRIQEYPAKIVVIFVLKLFYWVCLCPSCECLCEPAMHIHCWRFLTTVKVGIDLLDWYSRLSYFCIPPQLGRLL
jgi:hypothetical protein